MISYSVLSEGDERSQTETSRLAGVTPDGIKLFFFFLLILYDRTIVFLISNLNLAGSRGISGWALRRVIFVIAGSNQALGGL